MAGIMAAPDPTLKGSSPALLPAWSPSAIFPLARAPRILVVPSIVKPPDVPADTPLLKPEPIGNSPERISFSLPLSLPSSPPVSTRVSLGGSESSVVLSRRTWPTFVPPDSPAPTLCNFPLAPTFPLPKACRPPIPSVPLGAVFGLVSPLFSLRPSRKPANVNLARPPSRKLASLDVVARGSVGVFVLGVAMGLGMDDRIFGGVGVSEEGRSMLGSSSHP
jgi:hypothetical protein